MKHNIHSSSFKRTLGQSYSSHQMNYIKTVASTISRCFSFQQLQLRFHFDWNRCVYSNWHHEAISCNLVHVPTDWLNEWSGGINYPLHVLAYPAHMTFVFITRECRNEPNSSRCVCMCTSIPLSIRAYTSRSRGIRDIIYTSNTFITTAQKHIHLFFLHPWILSSPH